MEGKKDVLCVQGEYCFPDTCELLQSSQVLPAMLQGQTLREEKAKLLSKTAEIVLVR
jgi:hypothetical protein